MIFDKIDIRKALVKEQERQTSILEEVQHVLQLSSDKDKDVIRRIKKRKDSIDSLPFMPDKEDKKNIFSLNDIRSICIKYRLRFLNSSHFAAEIPYEAISKVHAFEKKYGFRIEDFKIVAPDTVFKLHDVNKDPLLLAKLGDDAYYLIHKWGDDMKWYRNILCYPFRSFFTFLPSVYILGLIIGFSMPIAWMNARAEHEIYYRIWLSVHFFIALTGFFVFLGAAFHRNFSAVNWRSHYFNG